MSATPLDSLLLATANQPGLLTPASRPVDARVGDFEDRLRDANKVTGNSPIAAKTASQRRSEDVEADVDARSSQARVVDGSAPDRSPAEEESNHTDGEDIVVVEADEIIETVEIELPAESGEREANSEAPSAEETALAAEVVSSSELPASESPAPEVEPGLLPAIAVEQGESTVVGNSTGSNLTSTVVAVAETLSADAQPVEGKQKAGVSATQSSQTVVPEQATEIETTTSGEETTDTVPTNPQSKSEQAASTALSSQSETLSGDSSTDQDRPQQEGSSKRSFGESQPSGEQTGATAETTTEKAALPLTAAKAEIAGTAIDINAQADRSPAEPIANAGNATESGRSEGLLGTLGKLQQSAGRAVQSTSEASSSNQPRVDSARFVGRVARAFQIAQDRGGTIQLRLSPPELGALKLQVTIEQGVLSATIDAETDAARNALLDNLPALRAKLAEQDIRIDKFDVHVGREGGDSPQEFETQEREQRGNNTTRQALRGENSQINEQANAAIDITEITAGDNNINLLI